jgi:hypothetical protein
MDPYLKIKEKQNQQKKKREQNPKNRQQYPSQQGSKKLPKESR